MKLSELTNESLQKVAIGSNFELVHYAIALARYLIRSGREVGLHDVLKEIQRHPNPNYLRELEEIDNIIEE